MTRVKYSIPHISDIVPRERLLDLLNRNKNCRIFMVTGQAAQGKSTLVASFLNRPGQSSLWFYLTPDASDHTKLFDVIINGVEGLFKEREDSKKIHIPQTTLGTREDLLRQVELCSQIFGQLDFPLNIVLDDLETLDEKGSSFTLIQRLIEETPDQVKFFLLSRTLPALSLHKLKMKRTLFSLGNEDLAFTLDEAVSFFKTKAIADGEMDPLDVKRVLKITEGWAGGLVLVSESMKRFTRIEKLPDHLSSEAFSYFSHEIYDNLRPDVRSFLMETSDFELLDTRMLDKFYPDIDSVAILSEFENRNLFTQKIDSDRMWPVFKYNNLFRDFLKAELLSSLGTKGYEALNRKNGYVFWEHKFHEEAMRSFVIAKEYDQIAKIIRIKGTDYVITGRTSRIGEWIDVLPQEMVEADPWLLFFKTITRRIMGGKKNIDAFSRALKIFQDSEDSRGVLLCTAYLIEATVFMREPSPVILTWIEAGEKCLKLHRGKHRYTWARTLLWQQIGLGYIAGNGDIPKGISACRNAVLLARRIKNRNLLVNGYIILTLGFVQSGDFSGAREMLEKLEDITREDHHPEYRALKTLTSIDYALKKGDFELSGKLLEKSETDIEKFGLLFLYPGFVEARATHFVYTGQFAHALQDADHLSDFSILEGNDFYLGMSHRIRAMSYLRAGKYGKAKDAAFHAVEELGSSKRGDIYLFIAKQIYGFALFYTDAFEEALDTLEEVLSYFDAISADLFFCETSFIMGLASLEMGNEKRAADNMQAGVRLAMENYYDYFPQLTPRTIARIIVKLAIILPETEKEAFNDKALVSYQEVLLSRGISPHVRDEIINELAGVAKKDKGIRVDQLRSLYRLTRPEIRISTLGEFNVRLSDSDREKALFEGAKPLRLLKAIVLRGGISIPREILIDTLWPEAGAAAGDKNFKVNFHRLRKAIEPDALKEFGCVYLSQKSGLVSLDTDLVSIDIDEFSKLAAAIPRIDQEKEDELLAACSRAVDLYGGDFFVEEPYLEWIEQQRELYKSKYIEILRTKALLHENMNQWQDAVTCWRLILGADSCFEPACRNLMILYADAGRKAEAFQLFKEFSRVLKNELDTEPATETIDIYNTIGGGKP